MRFASIAICVIVSFAFIVFAADQTKSASGVQQEQIAGTSKAVVAGSTPGAATPAAHESSVHRTLEDASNDLTSPFAGVVSGMSSEWAVHGVKLLLALLVYGFGLGYLARILRVRV